MAITGLPRPLPECKRCPAPVRRHVALLTGGICRACLTPAEVIAAEHRRHDLIRLAKATGSPRAGADARIAALAAKRADREAQQRR